MTKLFTFILLAFFVSACSNFFDPRPMDFDNVDQRISNPQSTSSNNQRESQAQPESSQEDEPEPEREPRQEIIFDYSNNPTNVNERRESSSTSAVSDPSNDLYTNPGEHWRPRTFDYGEHCHRASESRRLLPSQWMDEYVITKTNVMDHSRIIMPDWGEENLDQAREGLRAVSSHVEFWEYWCPPTGLQWTDAHTIFLVGLWHFEDAYYFLERYAQTSDPEYLERAWQGRNEGWRYIDHGIRDALPAYGDHSQFAVDRETMWLCLYRGASHIWSIPLCDDYYGPVTDPDSYYYNPHKPTVSQLLEEEGPDCCPDLDVRNMDPCRFGADVAAELGCTE